MKNYTINTGQTFYATATSKEGKSFVIKLVSGLRASALSEAKVECKKKGLQFEGLYPVKQVEKRGDTLTKYYKERKQSKQKRK